jgi:hypothetical protein
MNTRPEIAMQRGVIHSATAARPESFPSWKKLVIGGLAALLPKCFGCVAGWLAIAAGIRTITPEICGDTTGTLGFRITYFGVLGAVFVVWVVPMAWKRVRRISLRPVRVSLCSVARRIR